MKPICLPIGCLKPASSLISVSTINGATTPEPTTKAEPTTAKAEPTSTKAEPESTKAEPETTKAEPETTKAEPEKEPEPETTKAEPEPEGEAEAEPVYTWIVGCIGIGFAVFVIVGVVVISVITCKRYIDNFK